MIYVRLFASSRPGFQYGLRIGYHLIRALSVLSVLCRLCVSNAYGQVMADSSVSLPHIDITETRIRLQTTGSAARYWSNADLEALPVANVAELLASETGVYVKNYGPGTLATASARGGAAGHTLVLWNGLPIQNPMLGQLDLSLASLQASESVCYVPGGNSVMWGAGAVGGVIHLDNQADFSQKSRVKLGAQWGSFGRSEQDFHIGLGNKRLQSVSRFAHVEADNDFYYFLADGIPPRQQSNARMAQRQFFQDFYWKIKERRRLSVHVWRQASDRQIPPTNVQTRSEARRRDEATRLILDYEHILNKGLLKWKAGIFDERLDYFDDLILLESRSHFSTFLAEVTGQWSWRNKHQFLLGNTHTHTRAWAAGYRENIPAEYKTALFGSWQYAKGPIKTQLSVRQEWWSGQWAPSSPALGFEYGLNAHWTLKALANRNYRLPTLNDRFWSPGGNPDLIPESGWGQEITLSRDRKSVRFPLHFALTVFNRNIDDWILWSRRQEDVFWSAHNIAQVWSKGVESRFDAAYLIQNWAFRVRGGYDFVRSTNQIAIDNPRMAAGSQLIYTPVHQAFGAVSVSWKTLSVVYHHDYTGATEGINDSLDAFQVGNLRLQSAGRFKKCKATLFFNIHNIWDARYVVVERRPMPGIHFQSGIQLYFHQNK